MSGLDSAQKTRLTSTVFPNVYGPNFLILDWKESSSDRSPKNERKIEELTRNCSTKNGLWKIQESVQISRLKIAKLLV